MWIIFKENRLLRWYDMGNRFAAALKYTRERRGISLRDAAYGIGIAPVYLNEMEEGKRLPVPRIVFAIMDYYNFNFEQRRFFCDILAEVTNTCPCDIAKFIYDNTNIKDMVVDEMRSFMEENKKNKL